MEGPDEDEEDNEGEVRKKVESQANFVSAASLDISNDDSETEENGGG